MLAWRFHLGRVDQVLSYIIASAAGIETILMSVIAVKGWSEIVENRRASASVTPTSQVASESDRHGIVKGNSAQCVNHRTV
ncbi:hypothetical protein FA13DRAFT_1747525, partial [Coprinellus micaceus]